MARVRPLFLSVLLAVAAAPGPPAPADIVLLNGTIITVDAKDSVAEAIAIKDGRISFVGSTGEARRFVGPATRVVDLAGRAATPGLIDSSL